MLADQVEQFLAVEPVIHQGNLDHVEVAIVVEGVRRIIDISYAAGHTGCEVAYHGSQHDDAPARHILAAMVARPFHDGFGTGITDRETLARPPGDIQFTAGLYVAGTDGKFYIFSTDKEFRLLQTVATGEKTFATPAFTDGKMVVRTNNSLYCVAKK